MWLAIKLAMSSVWTFLLPFLQTMLTSAGQILAASALSAVKQVAADPTMITDIQKRDMAFALIVKNLETQGIQLGTSVVNAALEAAVLKLKSI